MLYAFHQAIMLLLDRNRNIEILTYYNALFLSYLLKKPYSVRKLTREHTSLWDSDKSSIFPGKFPK